MGGCHSPELEFQPELSSPEPKAEGVARPLRLQAHVYTGPAKLRFKTVLDALRGRGHVVSLGRWGAAPVSSASAAPASSSSSPKPKPRDDVAEEPSAPDPTLEGEPDYVIRVGLRIVGRPWGVRNFLVTWVFGPTFGAPGWAGMGYTYEVATEIQLARVGAAAPFTSTTVLDTYRLIYTSDEYAWLIYFWDLGCLSGIVSTWDELADESELAPVEEAFFADEALCEHYLRRVTAAIERAAGADPER
jgi:hypothetical protein